MTLEGRSPFEEVMIESYIPKAEQWLLSGAIVAAQTGNVLAGLFYLRSFIEQFARRQTGLTGRVTGEEIFAAYQELLPENYRAHMPSLGSWYEQLSVPIHAASADMSVFEEAKSDILEHFDFRRIYKLTELNQPAKTAQKPEDSDTAEKK